MNSQKYNHLTLDDRIRIKQMLNENLSLRKIADVLDYNVTSISREIFRMFIVI